MAGRPQTFSQAQPGLDAVWGLQVTKVFPELACRMVQLHQNRRTWQERYLSSLEADPSLASAERAAEKACLPCT